MKPRKDVLAPLALAAGVAVNALLAASFAPLPARAAVRCEAVSLAPAVPESASSPYAAGQFYTHSWTVTRPAGDVALLAASPDGKEAFWVDDRLTLTSSADGHPTTPVSWDFFSDDHRHIEAKPPLFIDPALLPEGVSVALSATEEDLFPDHYSASALYVVFLPAGSQGCPADGTVAAQATSIPSVTPAATASNRTDPRGLAQRTFVPSSVSPSPTAAPPVAAATAARKDPTATIAVTPPSLFSGATIAQPADHPFNWLRLSVILACVSSSLAGILLWRRVRCSLPTYPEILIDADGRRQLVSSLTDTPDVRTQAPNGLLLERLGVQVAPTRGRSIVVSPKGGADMKEWRYDPRHLNKRGGIELQPGERITHIPSGTAIVLPHTEFVESPHAAANNPQELSEEY